MAGSFYAGALVTRSSHRWLFLGGLQINLDTQTTHGTLSLCVVAEPHCSGFCPHDLSRRLVILVNPVAFYQCAEYALIENSPKLFVVMQIIWHLRFFSVQPRPPLTSTRGIQNPTTTLR